jgi:hypothetical protein
MRVMPAAFVVGHVQVATENSNACTMPPAAHSFLQLRALRAPPGDATTLCVDLRQVAAVDESLGEDRAGNMFVYSACGVPTFRTKTGHELSRLTKQKTSPQPGDALHRIGLALTKASVAPILRFRSLPGEDAYRASPFCELRFSCAARLSGRPCPMHWRRIGRRESRPLTSLGR